MGKERATKGTKEWADSNVNIYYGCSNDCGYCYAKRMALRFGRIDSAEEWKNMKLNEKALNKNYKKRKGRIMFPTSHDITVETYENCLKVLRKLLKAGNEVLITTKPVDFLIKNLCEELIEYKSQIQFRFTITTIHDSFSELEEPNAPLPYIRLKALFIAFYKGFKTSVSIEPFLDDHPISVIIAVAPYCTESIWLGIMSGCKYFCHSSETLERIIDEINSLPHEIRSKVRLKDSIRNLGYEVI